MEKRVELLAPCGSYESFLAAVNAGADAVYLGGREFGARAYAENFSEEELVSVIRQAHLFGVKVYLTVNTLVKEREFIKIYDYMLPLYQAGLDGVIVQDMGVFGFLKRNFPELKFHASTQMTITGAYGAACLKEAGCERIVPARELSLQEIKDIKEKVSVEIEAFIHGAMCYCYSGQCLMSSMIGGRSGNRGRCAQPCRLPYKTAGKEGYFLSLKDMNTLEHIPELIEAGIDSFKIEGRMKKPEYVAGVVSIYRKYIDKYYEESRTGGSAGTNGSYDIKNILNSASRAEMYGEDRAEADRKIKRKPVWKVSSKDRQLLANLYIRSETGSGYYFKGRGAEMLTLQKPGYNEADQELLERLRKTYVRELPGRALDLYVRCRAGEPLYGEVRLVKTAGRLAGKVYLPDAGGEPDGGGAPAGGEKEAGICYKVWGPAAEHADKRSVSEEEIRGQLVKTGGTPFVVEKCEVELGENTFVPMKWVKQLRRELLQKVYEAYGARETENRRKERDEQQDHGKEKAPGKINGGLKEKAPEKINGALKEKKPGEIREGSGDNCSLTIMVQTKEQFETVISFMEGAGRGKAGERQRKGIREIIIADADLLLEEEEIRDRLFGGKIHWGIKCPVILRKSDEGFLKKLQAVIEEGRPEVIYCGTVDVLAWVKSISYPGKIAGEASLYAWNHEAVLFWEKELDHISIPLELESREIRELCMMREENGAARHTGTDALEEAVSTEKGRARSGRLEALIYGRTPFMVSANCIKLSSGHCDKNRRNYTELVDRMGNKFPVYTNCGHCYNIIYNHLPTSYHENLWMLRQDGIRAFRIEFTTENKGAAEAVLQTFHMLLASELKIKKGKIAGMETTQGRFRRPVE